MQQLWSYPDPEEDAQISAAIVSDPNDVEIDDASIARARPAEEVFDSETLLALRSLRHARLNATPEAEPEKSIHFAALSPRHPRG